MSARDLKREVANATRELARLSQLADGLRAQLFDLQHDLAVAHRDVDGNHAAKLLEANARLVQAALVAQAELAAALESLEALSRTSQNDPLTGLPNRALMLDRMDNAIALAHRHQKCLAVLFINVDNLKQVNEAHGRKAGDEMLQRIAQRLQVLVRHPDTVSRYGGDEFMVLLSELSDAADAIAVVEKMMAALALPGTHGDESLGFSVSVGVAMFPKDGDDAATLIERADEALYAAKRNGPGRYVLHGMEETAPDPERSLPVIRRSRRRALEGSQRDLREANTQLMVTALKAQTQEADAREDHRRQIQYMSMVAHELRNPLTPIRVAASLLTMRSTADMPSLSRLQTIIEGQVVHMARLVEDLLEGSRVSMGKLRLEFGSVDMGEVLDLALQSCDPGMQARQHTITVHRGPEPLHVHGDPVRLVQVLCNLLDNACKYTPVGGAIILSASASDGVLTIAIKDNGVGISPLAISRIFDLFEQDEHAMALALDSRGLGIGLAVVRELVHAHGGTVAAHSEGKGMGSEFVVTLPIEARRTGEASTGL